MSQTCRILRPRRCAPLRSWLWLCGGLWWGLPACSAADLADAAGEAPALGGADLGSDAPSSDPAWEVADVEATPPACDELVLRTCDVPCETDEGPVPCGARDAPRLCARTPACKAAELTRAHEPDSCGAALEDAQAFPRCVQGYCTRLVDKTCGGVREDGGRPCAGDPGCGPAAVLAARYDDEAADQTQRQAAAEACQRALEDEIVFAPCLEQD